MQACFVLPEHCMAGLVESNSSARAIRKTALRVLIVAAATVLLIKGAQHIQMSARKNMQACFVLPEHYMAELLR